MKILDGVAEEKCLFLTERGATVKEVVLQKENHTAHIDTFGKVKWDVNTQLETENAKLKANVLILLDILNNTAVETTKACDLILNEATKPEVNADSRVGEILNQAKGELLTVER